MKELQFKYFTIVGIIAVVILSLVTLLSLYLFSAHAFFEPNPLLVVGEVLSDILFSVFFIGYFSLLKASKSSKILIFCSCILSIASIFICIHTRATIFGYELRSSLILLILFFSEPFKWILFFTGLRNRKDIDKNTCNMALCLIIIVSVLCIGNMLPLPRISYLGAGVFIEPVFEVLLLLLFVMMIKSSPISNPSHKNQSPL